MRVHILYANAGRPDLEPGQVYELEEGEALALVLNGDAELAPDAPPEAAAEPADPERATEPRAEPKPPRRRAE